MKRIALHVGLALCLGTLLIGCTTVSHNMRPVASAPPTLVAPADAALVVFLRSSRLGKGMMFTVIDENGNFLGDAQAGARFVVKVPPGEHMFVTWAENTGPMRANLAPGRIYYVEVNPRFGVFKGRVDLLAIAPRTELWKGLADELGDTELLEPDTKKGQASLATKQDKVQRALKNGKEVLTELDKQELMERTLLPEDGIASDTANTPSGTPVTAGSVAPISANAAAAIPGAATASPASTQP